MFASFQAIVQAKGVIRDGGLVAFPTETVYGLGADATNDTAVASIFSAKGRPTFNPLIVHFSRYEDVDEYANMTRYARVLARHFWPGPLTMIVERKAGSELSHLISAGLDSVAVRVPDNHIARALIDAVGAPLAAPSANRSGSISPTKAEHVAKSLGDGVNIILDGGECEVGLESTVLDLTHDEPVILRPGAITASQIEEVLMRPVTVKSANMPLTAGDVGLNDNGEQFVGHKSPGQLTSHYAPSIPLRMNATYAKEGEALLGFGHADNALLNLSYRGDVNEAAANLFAMLHQLDCDQYKGIAVMNIPNEGLGVAINDRLRRAAAPRK
ncbi:MAG: threonylcarbamoyl-AMP synthase [Alphaproteobacteria bacterium]|nr:threonylcarbamoyl-AMP synthase [Alphaproteobacteria bacterium]